MTQPRALSALEAACNTVAGYGIGLALLHWGFDEPVERSASIAGVFLVASLVRSYVIRRVFA